jgi:SAM-dependent methyltransferase
VRPPGRPKVEHRRAQHEGASVNEPASEVDAVRVRYARRNPTDPRYQMLNPAVWQSVLERQRETLRLLARVAPNDLAQLDVLEVGCGGGGNLLELLRFGFDAARLHGIELLEERHALARHALPAAVRLTLGDASNAAVPSESCEIVLQSTVFSSLLDDAFQQRLADAMWRWVKPGGGVLWYDFKVNNPRNADVRGVPLARVRELFPHGVLQSRRITLAPPIARAVTRVHPSLYTVFNAVPLLRTHVLAWIAKP